MPGTRQKPPDQLSFKRGGRGRTLDVDVPDKPRKVPPMPREVSSPRAVWLPPPVIQAFIEGYGRDEGLATGMTPEIAEQLRVDQARKELDAIAKRAQSLAGSAWRAWWRSTTSLPCKAEDEEPLRRWIIAVFQWALFDAVDFAMPMVPGANHTWVRNPISRKVKDLEGRLARVEDRYGMNTAMRFRFQLNVLDQEKKKKSLAGWQPDGGPGGAPDEPRVVSSDGDDYFPDIEAVDYGSDDE